jgi:hypothetical protein
MAAKLLRKRYSAFLDHRLHLVELSDGEKMNIIGHEFTFFDIQLLSGKLDDAPFVSLFGDEPHWKGGPSAHCLI